MSERQPNVVFVFADQMRAQATGYAGDPNVQTPCLDRLAAASVNFTTAVSGCPVCTPYRASLIAGRYPLTTGVFLNDVCLNTEAVSVADAYNGAGYDTGYIGKWHIDGHGRSNFIPRERRQGFDFWKVLECTHNYNDSPYFGDEDEKLAWEGYDAEAQTREAQQYIREHAGGDKPFCLFLSWGPPHNPYETAPEEFKKLYKAEDLELRPNIPEALVNDQTRAQLAGYYAHISALDAYVADLLGTLEECAISDDTVFVFTSDHGDMLCSQGLHQKQVAYDESILVPFLLRYPRLLGNAGREAATPINTPDIMPTLLGLCGIEVPDTVEGLDYSDFLRGGTQPDVEGALITCPTPFGCWPREWGGREYRGVRTRRHTYVRNLDGPWLLFDNERDPFQMENLCDRKDHAALQAELEALLQKLLKQTNDEFLPGADYIEKWGYTVDKSGTVPYTW